MGKGRKRQGQHSKKNSNQSLNKNSRSKGSKAEDKRHPGPSEEDSSRTNGMNSLCTNGGDSSSSDIPQQDAGKSTMQTKDERKVGKNDQDKTPVDENQSVHDKSRNTDGNKSNGRSTKSNEKDGDHVANDKSDTEGKTQSGNECDKTQEDNHTVINSNGRESSTDDKQSISSSCEANKPVSQDHNVERDNNGIPHLQGDHPNGVNATDSEGDVRNNPLARNGTDESERGMGAEKQCENPSLTEAQESKKIQGEKSEKTQENQMGVNENGTEPSTDLTDVEGNDCNGLSTGGDMNESDRDPIDNDQNPKNRTQSGDESITVNGTNSSTDDNQSTLPSDPNTHAENMEPQHLHKGSNTNEEKHAAVDGITDTECPTEDKMDRDELNASGCEEKVSSYEKENAELKEELERIRNEISDDNENQKLTEEIYSLKEQLAERNEKFEKLDREMKTRNEDISYYEEEIKRLQNEIQSKPENRSSYQKEIERLKTEIQSKTEENATLIQRWIASEDKSKQLSENISSYEEKIECLQNENEIKIAENATLVQRWMASEDKSKQLSEIEEEARNSCQELEIHLTACQEKVSSYEKENADLKEELERIRTDYNEKQKLTEEVQHLKELRDQEVNAGKEKDTQMEQLKEELRGHENSLAEIRQQLAERNEKFEKLDREMKTRNEDNAAILHKHLEGEKRAREFEDSLEQWKRASQDFESQLETTKVHDPYLLHGT